MKFLSFFIILFFGLIPPLMAQKPDSTILKKGRYITGLSGSIVSQDVLGNNNSSGKNQRINEYSIGTQSGYFIKNKWVLGVDFNLSKIASTTPHYNYASESLRLGLWTRYYFATYEKGALFADLTPFYTVVNQENNLNVGNINTSEELRGKGVGLESSLGFAYLINKNVGFGMAVAYQFGTVNANREDYLMNTITPESYNFTKLMFRFSFQVYLDQFFF